MCYYFVSYFATRQVPLEFYLLLFINVQILHFVTCLVSVTECIYMCI